jgi:tRNA-2-methylthio-N6-dimethylallyladenosine synthase
MIAWFPTETEPSDTLSLMEYVKYNFGYMYSYSERPGTLAGGKMEDDAEKRKQRRLQEIVDLQKTCLARSEVHWSNCRSFVEKVSKKSTEGVFWKKFAKHNGCFPKDYKIGFCKM